MKKILFFSSSRSDFGIVSSILKKFKNDEKSHLILCLSGSHLDKSFGNSQQEIREEHYDSLKKILIKNIGTSNEGKLIDSLGHLLKKMGSIFAEEKPDILLLLGDRQEIILPAFCALLYKIPIAHIGGGDVTLGAIDDEIRNAVSMMSDYHFVTNTEAMKRLVEMKIPKNHIYLSGSPSESMISKILYDPPDRTKFLSSLGIDVKEHILVCTYHPETKNKETFNDLKVLLNTLKILKKKDYSIIFTASNGDTLGNEFNSLIIKECSKLNNFYFLPTLGIERYLKLLSVSSLVLGNSSSGLHEAPSFNIPTLDIGNRQAGRARGNSVFNIPAKQVMILEKIDYLLRNKNNFKYSNPYISSDSSNVIYKEIKKLMTK